MSIRTLSDVALEMPIAAPEVPARAAPAGRRAFVTDRFEQAAAGAGDRCAVIDGDARITFRALNEAADAEARRLIALGCGPDTVVAVCLDRSAALIAALLGVWKAGAAFLPLDPAFPAERSADLARRAKALVVLTQPEYAERFGASGGEVVTTRAGDAAASGVRAWASASVPPPACYVSAAQLAYIIYTSGSTGTPKAVAVSHEALAGYLAWAIDFYPLDREGGAIVHTSVAFDLTLTSLFVPLLAGMSLIVAPDRDGLEAVLRVLDDPSEPVSLLKVTPSHLRLMAEAGDADGRRWRCGTLIVGGEQLTTAAVRFWERRCPGSRVFNEYGPTEATVGCCVAEVAAGEAPGDAALPIGEAIAPARLRIDTAGEGGGDAGGDAGELFIGGVTLARGYLGEPRQTAARFVPDPAGDGGRLYRTGDWVTRIAGNGALYFSGRRDRQCKINGIRIEPEEIEAALREYPGVRAAAVAPVRTAGQPDALAAFLELTAAARATLDRGAIATFAGTRVPAAVVPRQWFVVDALPVGIGGKVQLDVLIRDRHRATPLRDAFLPPRNPTEELLASLWRAVLDCEDIGIDDSFFALDGNSMKSIQFIYQAKQHGLALTTRDLFQHQTIRRLAEVIARARTDDPEAPAAASGTAAGQDESGAGPFALLDARDRARLPAQIVDAYPLAHLQAGTVFESDRQSGSGTYHNVNSYQVECDLDPNRFRQAVALVAARHPILRTAYDFVTYRVPLQLVWDHAEIPVYVFDIGHRSREEQDRHIAAFIEEESRRPFDWTRPPLLRFFMHVRGPRRAQFTLSKHHSILDGWSAATLMAEIVYNYFALRKGEPPPFVQPVATTYRDFVALEQQALRSTATRAFWRETMRDAPYHALEPWGAGQPRPDCPHSSITTRIVPIAAAASDGLKAVARRAQTPLKSVLLGAHLRAIAEMTGDTRVVTGVVSHGRPESADADRAIGLFINTIPFHLALDERDTWIDQARRVFREECRVFPHQRYPMARIKKDVSWERLFDSIFYYTNFHVFRGFRASDDLTFIDSAGFEETELPFTAAFSLHPLTSQISLALHFHVRHFSEQQIARTVAIFTRTLAAVVGEPHRSVLLPVAPDLDAPAGAAGRRERAASGPVQRIFDAFRDQARVQPETVAIAGDDRRCTYGALLRKVERDARRLRKEGVGAGATVGIQLADPLEAIAAMLAINAAGAAFVVVDPAWPAARIEEVLRLAAPVLVLVERPEEPGGQRWPWRSLALDVAAPAADDGPVVEAKWAEHDLAYVMFTSGSTGAPKGVMITHANLFHATRSRLEYYPRIERFLLLSRLTFDSAFAGVWGTLCGGGTLHVLDESHFMDVAHVAGVMARESITDVLAVPSLYRVLVGELSESARDALRTPIVAGEALTIDLVREHAARLPRCPLFNEYGPTEAAIWATVARIDGDGAAADPGSVSIGGPLPHIEAWICDAGLRPVSPGVIGELLLGGPSVSPGYRGRPAETARRFVPDPRASGDGAGATLYRTGDLVRLRPDGALDFVGRIDHQVKIRGVRVEPEEIERVCREAVPGCEPAVVLHEDASGRKRLCLYYAPPEGAADDAAPLPSRQSVAASLRERLPNAMMPDEIETIERLPRLWNGKLDRRTLAARPPSPSRATPAAPERPSSEVERALAGFWHEALGTGDVGVRDNFFEAGGDSLLANQVALRVSKLFGARLLLKEFYASPTIAAHAALMVQKGQAARLDVERIAAIWNALD